MEELRAFITVLKEFALNLLAEELLLCNFREESLEQRIISCSNKD
jgi:hypothetical protein